MGQRIRFILPEKTHTNFETATSPVRLVNVRDGDTAAVEDIGYPGADHFVSRGMAVYVEDPPHGEADKKKSR